MDNKKFTKGKWESKEMLMHNGQMIISIYEEGKDINENSIAGIWGLEDKDFSNAKLIASAPEMLEMLERIMVNYDKGTQTYLDCKQLISKITE